MSEDDFELDEHLRRRLRMAARSELPAPSSDGPARVHRALLKEAERRARVRRFETRLAGGVLAAASLLLGYRLAYEPAPEPQARVAAPACALPLGPSSRFELHEGRDTLDLGRFGRVVAAPSAVMRITRADACELELELSRGELAFDLHNLRPARLRVRTPLTTVHVRGTQFSLRVESEVDLVLVSGSVDITDSQAHTTRLSAGQRLRSMSGGRKSAVSAITAADTRAFHALLAAAGTRAQAAETVVPVEPEPPAEASDKQGTTKQASAAPPTRREKPARAETRSTADLLAEAESERRARRLNEARALYERASTRRDADAEVALLRWARLEQSDHKPSAAHLIVRRYLTLFSQGRLRAEAHSLEIQLLRELGREEEAKAAARRLVEAYPDSPHAKAAREEVLR